MSEYKIVELTTESILDYGVCGYKDAKKHVELQKKVDWYKKYHEKGLRIKVILSEDGKYQGMIEYIPGEYAHRPVDAKAYLFIQCLFVGFNKDYKGKGFGSALLDDCMEQAKELGLKGVATVTRKGSFMASGLIFDKYGFEVVDQAKPDFQVMVKKFDANSKNPKFFETVGEVTSKYKKGLTIIRSVQCPYTEKNVKAIIDTAENEFKLDVKLVDLQEAKEVQASPCPFGTFCMIYNGEIISHHPISNGRFKNIMNKIEK